MSIYLLGPYHLFKKFEKCPGKRKPEQKILVEKVLKLLFFII